MKAIYIPAGPKNLSLIFPSLNFNEIAEYTLELRNPAGVVVATTTKYILSACPEDLVRIHFLNSLGAIDAVNFNLITVELDSKSDSFEQPTSYPLQKSKHALGRFNVKSNDTYLVKSVEYGEEQMPWISELFNSPLAWMEWVGTQGQTDSYLPIVILDQKVNKVKEEDRFVYEVSLQFKLSHEKVIIRN